MPNIYLLQDSGDAVELSEQPYDSEDILQRLLAEHLDVLGGDQIGGGRARRWLLPAKLASPAKRPVPTAGRSITCSWTRTAHRPSSK